MLQRLLIRLTNRLDRLRGGSTRSPAAEASARQSADLMIAEGIRAESSGNPQEACEQYRMAVRAAPRYARAHLNLGIGLQAVGDAEGALRSYEAALAPNGCCVPRWSASPSFPRRRSRCPMSTNRRETFPPRWPRWSSR